MILRDFQGMWNGSVAIKNLEMVAKKLCKELLKIVDFLLIHTWHNHLVQDKDATSGNNILPEQNILATQSFILNLSLDY